MATLKEDSDSWRASGLEVRDARHTHDGPEVPQKARKKNTKKWCKGKVGREHILGTKPLYEQWLTGVTVVYCTACGKHIKYNWPPRYVA